MIHSCSISAGFFRVGGFAERRKPRRPFNDIGYAADEKAPNQENIEEENRDLEQKTDFTEQSKKRIVQGNKPENA
jgi:hypothetical protein